MAGFSKPYKNFAAGCVFADFRAFCMVPSASLLETILLSLKIQMLTNQDLKDPNSLKNHFTPPPPNNRKLAIYGNLRLAIVGIEIYV